jgi:hypothetical protein
MFFSTFFYLYFKMLIYFWKNDKFMRNCVNLLKNSLIMKVKTVKFEKNPSYWIPRAPYKIIKILMSAGAELLMGSTGPWPAPVFFSFNSIGFVSYIYLCAYQVGRRFRCIQVVEYFTQTPKCPGFNSHQLQFLLFIKFFQF